MELTSADLMDASGHHFTPHLFSPASVAAMRAVAGTVPIAGLGFEVRLGEAAAAADLSVSLNRAQLRRCSDDGTIGQCLSGLLDTWEVETGPLADVRTVWAELDLIDGRSDAANIFLVLRPEGTASIVSALAAVGCVLPPAGVDTLDRCVRALPEDAQVFQLGVMLARPQAGARICVGPLTFDAAEEYLGSVGLPFGFALARQAAATTADLACCYLHLDVADRLGSTVGLEFTLPQGRLAKAHHWAPVLQVLIDAGLCQPAKRDAVLGWIGQERGSMVWPSVFLRCANHLKLVARQGRVDQAKIYLGLQHAWVDGQGFTSNYGTLTFVT